MSIRDEKKKRAIKMIVLCASAACIGLFYPREAFVSQIHYQYVSLKELACMSPCIFVVKRDAPHTTIKKIPIHQDRKKYPDFTHVTLHYEIIETLRGPEELSQGKKLSVLPAYQDEEFSLHKDYYLDHLSVSPIYRAYRAGVDPNTAASLIIFARVRGDGRFEYAVCDAYEDAGRKNEIMKLIRSADICGTMD